MNIYQGFDEYIRYYRHMRNRDRTNKEINLPKLEGFSIFPIRICALLLLRSFFLYEKKNRGGCPIRELAHTQDIVAQYNRRTGL